MHSSTDRILQEPWPFDAPKYVVFQGPDDDVYLCVTFDLLEAKRVIAVSVLLAVSATWVAVVFGAMLTIFVKLHNNKKTMIMSVKTYHMHLYFVRLLLAQVSPLKGSKFA